jgi:hypothetical protein
MQTISQARFQAWARVTFIPRALLDFYVKKISRTLVFTKRTQCTRTPPRKMQQMHINPFKYLLESLRFNLTVANFPQSLKSLLHDIAVIRSDIQLIYDNLSTNSEQAAAAIAPLILFKVMSLDLGQKLQECHDQHMKSNLEAQENTESKKIPGETKGSYSFEERNIPISALLEVLLGLLDTPREKRINWVLADGGWEELSREYGDKGREVYEKWLEM